MSESRKYTEAQKKSARKWDAANLDRISIALPKGKGQEIKAYAALHGESVNAFIGRAIADAMKPRRINPDASGGGTVSVPMEKENVPENARTGHSNADTLEALPNAATLEAFAELDSGGGYRFAGSTDELFTQLLGEQDA